MGLVEFINHIQDKPEPARKRIFSLAVAITMAVIIAFWFMSLRYTLELGQGGSADSEAASNLSPFTLLWDTVRQGFIGVSEQVKKLRSQ